MSINGSIVGNVLATVQAILLFGESTQACGRGGLATTGTWAMLSTNLGIIETSHHHVIIVSEFAWSVDPLLNVDILTGEFLDLAFDSILHEMLWLSSMCHLLTSCHARQTISCADCLRHVLIRKRHFLLFLESILSHCCHMAMSWKSRWRLHADTTGLSGASMSGCKCWHVLHIIVVLGSCCLILDPWVASAIREAVVHDLPSFSLILNASNLIMLLCAHLSVHLLVILISIFSCWSAKAACIKARGERLEATEVPGSCSTSQWVQARIAARMNCATSFDRLGPLLMLFESITLRF